MNNRIFFTIGLARSGKSTYSKQWQSYLDKESCTITKLCHYPRVVVNADTIRLALHGNRYNGYMEGWVSQLKDLFIRKYLLMGYDVLVDGTHTSENSIKRLLEIDHEAIPIIIPTTPEVCKERALSTNQTDLYSVIDRMYQNLLEMWFKYTDKPFEIDNLEEWNKIVNSIRKTVIMPPKPRVVV